jgi:hypothetical protein
MRFRLGMRISFTKCNTHKETFSYQKTPDKGFFGNGILHVFFSFHVTRKMGAACFSGMNTG